MRWIVFIVIGFVLIFSFSIFTAHQINQTAQVVQKQLVEVEKYIFAEQWDQAADQVILANKEWENMKKWWGMVINNNIISGIDISIKRVEQYVITEEKGHSLAELHTLILLLNDVPSSETLKANNIL